MSSPDPHNRAGAEDQLRKALDASKTASGFVVPENFFDSQSSAIISRAQLESLRERSGLETPENYFEDAQNRILSSLDGAAEAHDPGFFAEQQDAIFALIRLEERIPKSASEFAVPTNYFDSTADKILTAAVGLDVGTPVIPFRKKQNARMWIAIAAAACIAFIALMILPNNDPPASNMSFSELLEKTDLDDEDLAYFATDEEVDELLLSEIDLFSDTTQIDSLTIVFPSPAVSGGEERLKPNKKEKKEIKPKDKKKTLSFDDLTEDEILEYLLEEGGSDVLDDL